MTKLTVDADGQILVASWDEPVCGQDFCEKCGLCMTCDTFCELDGMGEHLWQVTLKSSSK